MLTPYFAIASMFAGIALLLGTAILVGWFDPKARAERAMRAHLEAHKRRQAAIVSILAEWDSANQPTTIEGEFSVLHDLRSKGAL